MKNLFFSSLGLLALCAAFAGAATNVEANLPDQTNTLIEATGSVAIQAVTHSTQVTNKAPGKATGRATGKTMSRNTSERVAVLSDVTVGHDEAVGDLIVIGGRAEVRGKVNGELILVMSEAELTAEAEVKQGLILVNSVVNAPPEARLATQRLLIAGSAINAPSASWRRWPQQWFREGLLMGRPLPPRHGWAWAGAALATLAGALLLILLNRRIEPIANTLETQPGWSYLVGLVALLVTGPLLALLGATIVGLIVVPFVCLALLGTFVLGKAVLYCHAGRSIGRQFRLRWLENPLTGFFAGALLFMILYTIPFAGALIWLGVVPWALGVPIRAVALAIASRPKTTPAGDTPASVAPPLMAETPQGLAQLPRAGFWLRLTATALDLILVAIVCGLSHLGKWFIPVWAIYHMALWGWRGTTVGGIICGLRIVRSNGRAMTFPVAAVRSLASFFSFVVLGLGFFWVGWSRQKNSWHDLIADTIVVRLPRGLAAGAPAAA